MANLHMLCEVKYENALALNAKGHLVSQDDGYRIPGELYSETALYLWKGIWKAHQLAFASALLLSLFLLSYKC